jgi:uncharacterized protein YndB with AHSA1/START domain
MMSDQQHAPARPPATVTTPTDREIHIERNFEDLGDRTRLTTTSLFHTTEERDGMLGSGMEGGMNETYARLDELLERLAEA